MKTIINLTPHAITIRTSAGGIQTEIPPSGDVARVDEEIYTTEPIGSTRTTLTYPRGIIGLPDPVDGTYCVVSQMTADAAWALGRSTDDLLMPGQQTRGADGRVDGCASLVRYRPMHTRVSDPSMLVGRVMAHAVRHTSRTQWGYDAELGNVAVRFAWIAAELGTALAPGPDGDVTHARLDRAIDRAKRDLHVLMKEIDHECNHRHRYVSISENEIPEGTRWHVPRRNQGQHVEVAFANATPHEWSEADDGDMYKRVTDHSDGSVRYARLVTQTGGAKSA